MLTATGSRLADEAAAVAVVLHVVARTGDPRLAGLVVAAFALPTLVTGPLLGAVLDRIRTPRPLFLTNQAVLAAALAGILLLAGHAPGWVLIALGLLAGVTAPVLTGGYSALVPRLPRPAIERGQASLNTRHTTEPDHSGPAHATNSDTATPNHREPADAIQPYTGTPDHHGQAHANQADTATPNHREPADAIQPDTGTPDHHGQAHANQADTAAQDQRALARVNAVDAASYDVAGLGGPAVVAAIASLAGAGSALAAAAGLAAVGVLLVAIAPMPGPTADLAAKRSERSPAGATVAPTADLAAKRSERSPAGATVAPTANPGPLLGPDLPHTGPFLSEVRDGLALLWRVRALRATTAATTLGHAAQGLLPVTFPLLAIHFGHPAAHGAWFLTALSAGSLAGALASARLLARRPPVPVLGAALATLGLALVGVAAAPTLPVALVVAVLGGVATGPMLAATLAVRQQSVPHGRYGQVVATAASIKVGAYALGAAATGPVLTWLPPRGVLLLVGAAQFAAVPLLLGARPRSRPSAILGRAEI
ncbi:hypothetical protein DFJ67_6407 [Asanoa ferruginea]|uniref:Major facilitator superfamily (MFS) profile domain-containing protein n=4 Tax=Asanoa ferruginea TaxID=53367 RepID=A0A3D9ZUR0_9ACTN|nr:hypothetical protein DFJ67_6407 [Asanoa ferruginea]